MSSPADARPASSSVTAPEHILDPGLCLTLRPMRFPVFYDMFRDGIKNTWTVEEVDFQTDLAISSSAFRLPRSTSSSGSSRFSPPATASSPTTSCSISTSTSTRPRRGSTSPASSLKKRSMCSSTSLCSITTCPIPMSARRRSQPSRTFHRSPRRPTSA